MDNGKGSLTSLFEPNRAMVWAFVQQTQYLTLFSASAIFESERSPF
jgi:hypothetical protein